MGVPSLYNYLTTNYKITTNVQHTEVLYLDFNAIIHNSIRISEDTLFKNIGDYIDLLVEKVKPRIVYISVDGRAPVSKVYQQRCRRHVKGGKPGVEEWPYVKMKDVKHDDKNTKKGGGMYEEGSSDTEMIDEFDSNCITPGTPFMDRLDKFMHKTIKERLNSGKYTQLFIYSSCYVKGEGEQKILKHLNTHNLTSSIYSPDADLLFLTLQSKNTYVIREPHARCSKCGRPHKFIACEDVKRTELISVDINLLKKHLVEDTTKYISFQFSDERILADICFVNFLCGNDFVPRLLCFDVRFDGVGLLMTKLGKYYRTTGRYILKKRNNTMQTGRGQTNINSQRNRPHSSIHATNSRSLHKEPYDPASIEYKCIKPVLSCHDSFSSINKGYKPFHIDKRKPTETNRHPQPRATISYKDQLKGEHLFEEKVREEEPYYIDYELLKGFLQFLEKDEDYLYLRKVGLLKSMRKRFNLPDEEEIDLTKQEGKNKYYKEKLFRVIDENDSVVKKKLRREDDYGIEKAKSMDNMCPVGDTREADNTTHANGNHEIASDTDTTNSLAENTSLLYKKSPLDFAIPFDRKDLPLFDNDYTELRAKAGYEYMKALTWMTSLYLNNHVVSWSWYYPYHYPPLISDFLLNKDTSFDFYDNYDLSLLQQAVAVLPSGSKQNLPFIFQGLLKEYRIEIDMFDKLLDWQGVPLIPFCDLKELHDDFNTTMANFKNRCYNSSEDDKTKELVGKSLPVEYVDGISDSDKGSKTDNLYYANDDTNYYFETLQDMRNFYLDILYKNVPGDDVLFVHKSHPLFNSIRQAEKVGSVDIEIGIVQPYCYGDTIDETENINENGTMTFSFINKNRLEQ